MRLCVRGFVRQNMRQHFSVGRGWGHVNARAEKARQAGGGRAGLIDGDFAWRGYAHRMGLQPGVATRVDGAYVRRREQRAGQPQARCGFFPGWSMRTGSGSGGCGFSGARGRRSGLCARRGLRWRAVCRPGLRRRPAGRFREGNYDGFGGPNGAGIRRKPRSGQLQRRQQPQGGDEPEGIHPLGAGAPQQKPAGKQDGRDYDSARERLHQEDINHLRHRFSAPLALFPACA